MTLRNLLFAVMDVAFSLPRVLVLLLGAIGYAEGWATLGQITTAILYTEALWGPFDMLVHTVDRVQVGDGVDDPSARHRDRAADRGASDDRPNGAELVGHRPALRLPRRPRRAARHRPRPAHRRAPRHRRPERLRQVDARAAPVRHPRPAHGLGDRRRRRADVAAARPAAHRGRPRHAGTPRLHRLGARQRRARARGLDRRPGPRRRCGLSTPSTGSSVCPRGSTRSSARATRR